WRHQGGLRLRVVPLVRVARVRPVRMAHEEASLEELPVQTEVLDGDSAGRQQPVAARIDRDLRVVRQREEALLLRAIRPERQRDGVRNDARNHLGRCGTVEAARGAELSREVRGATARAGDDLLDAPGAVADHVKLAVVALAEADQRATAGGVRDVGLHARLAIEIRELPGDIVAEYVLAVEGRKRSAAVHEAARNRLGGRTAAVFAGRRGVGRAAVRRVAREARGALVVGPAIEAGRDDIHLFPGIFPDVAFPELARDAIEAETPRIAEAVGVDLG